MLEDILREYGGIEVSAMEVYSDMFHLGENIIQKEGEEKGKYKSNPLGYWKNNSESKGHYRILFEDSFEERLKELQEADFAIMNGLSYFGRKNVQAHASKMFAMIFDLDDVTDKSLENFLYAANNTEFMYYPLPNYIILSGHGVHLYYIFEFPIPLYPNIKFQLKELKYELTRQMWNRHTTKSWEKVQYQGINQGFRVIGGKTKVDGKRVRAFRMNSHPYTLDQLNEYVSEEHQIDQNKLWKESKLTLDEAKEKFPEWYEKRVVNGEPKGTWTCKEDLYQWWLRRISSEAKHGHRYFCVMCLAIYGAKSGVSKEQVEKDAMALIPQMTEISKENPFTESDVRSALECYDERYMTFPIDDIVKISGISIEKNKRNGRKQDVHLERARAVQKIDYPNNSWQNMDGRPKKEREVLMWQAHNPGKKKADCIRETGLSKKTVYKWWGEVENE